ncbi:MAG: CpsD/CapB family tyrosine-protein kinase [Clostridiales bacterium]|nr:CpsD/CapB family tyrosine-protein kinase [Clostridiales bacterium]
MKSLTFMKFTALDYSCTEAVNTLCTNLTFMGSKYKRIMVTSVNESEGKSFLSLQIMRTLSELGKYVVLVDADLRRSVIDINYRVRYADNNKLGITHFLAGKCEIDDVFYATDFKRAFFVPVGYAVSNSLALLNSPRFQNLLDQLAQQVDYVLVDSPPVGMIVDASEIAKSCDGALLTVGYNRVRRRDLMEARQQIERSGCTVLGAVLNNVPPSAYSSRKYLGRSYYGGYAAEYSKLEGKE